MRKKPPKILVTGGAGFIGSEFVRQRVSQGYKIIVLDKLTYAGDLKRLKSIDGKYKFYKVDICNEEKVRAVFKKERPTVVVHFAAETHVDRSIMDVKPFIKTNIEGTNVLIKVSLKYNIKKFIHISTDEVYGEIKRGKFTEESPLRPSNPYSATKASADLLIKAAIRTYKFPAIIIRPSNNYGQWQYPEKFIPVIILKALRNKKIPVYGKGENIREWLHVSDCNKAILTVMKKGKTGEIYNIGSNMEKRNIQVAQTILKSLNKPFTLIQFVKDRPGHDWRYSLSCHKIHKLGWRPLMTFANGINETLFWSQDNFNWLEATLKSLQSYWKKVYKNK